MAISVSEIQNRLQPFLLVNLKKEVLDMLVDSDYLTIFNSVAKDLNEEAQLRVERWNNTGGSDTAEDSGYTNYLMQGIILKVLFFKYSSSAWEDQYYTYVQDRIVTKTSAEGVEMDIHYLRDCEDVALTTDEIDLPDNVINDYMELLKVKLQIDYGEYTQSDYATALQYFGQKAALKKGERSMQQYGIFRHWMRQNDDSIYNITDHWLSLDNWVADVSGNYSYIGS